MLDHEHGPGSETTILHQLQAVAATPATCLVRIAANEPPRFKRVLDAGAHGVMVPYVSTAAEARAAVQSMRYPPRGMRGVAKLTRASAFGARFDEYFAHAHEWLVTLAQIETVDAVENAQEIAEVDGVDVVFVGPMDLTTSMGIPGQYGDARFHDALGEVADAAQSAGKAAGILLLDPANLPLVRELGLHRRRAGIGWRIGGGGAQAEPRHAARRLSTVRSAVVHAEGAENARRGELLSGSSTRGTGAPLLSIHNPKKTDFGVGIQPASPQDLSRSSRRSPRLRVKCSCSVQLELRVGMRSCGDRGRAPRIPRRTHPSIRSMLRTSGANDSAFPDTRSACSCASSRCPSPNSSCAIHGPARGFRHQSSSKRSTSVSVISAWSCHARR